MIFCLAVFTYIQFTFQLKKKKNGFTTFFLFTFLLFISSSLFSPLHFFFSIFSFVQSLHSPPPVPVLLSLSLSLSTFLVRFLASDLRNPFKLRNTLFSPFFSPLTFSSLLCASSAICLPLTLKTRLSIHRAPPFPSLRLSSLT